MRRLAWVAAVVTTVLAGCAGGSGGGGRGPTPAAPGGATGATGGAGGGGGAAATAGPLLARAIAIEDAIAARHTPDGLLVNLDYDAAGNVVGHGNHYDSCIWTGVYVGTEAIRFRVTGEAAALANVERGLRAMHDLQAITGEPGYVARYFGPAAMYPNEPRGTGAYSAYAWLDDTSRDQYVGLMFGYALAWDVIADPVLRATVQQDVRAIAERLMRDDMEIRVVRGGTTKVHFGLTPRRSLRGQITPQMWATVDDFPLNLIARSMPYDPLIAAALENAALPPIGGADAYHGLAFFRIAATITGDPAIESFYRNELLGRRGYLQCAENYETILDDLLAGEKLHLVEGILLDLNAALAGAVQAYLVQRLGVLGGPAAFALQLVLDAVLRETADAITDMIRFLNDPQRRAQAGQTAVTLVLLAQVLDVFGQPDAARTLRQIAGAAGTVAGADLGQLGNALRSYVGENLYHLSAYALLSLEPDPSLRSAYATLLDRHDRSIAAEGNAFFDHVAAGHGATPPDPARLARARASLDLYPAATDRFDRVVDNTGLPGVVPSPWPDRFGRVGFTALDVFPMDRRAPHHFVWQEHPRQIRRGSAARTELTHLGYLTAYWIGRLHGVIGPAD